MPRSLLRELSPREESTLCRIAQGISNQAGLRAGDVSCLENFGFVKTNDGVSILTPLGVQRVAISTLAPRLRRLADMAALEETTSFKDERQR